MREFLQVEFCCFFQMDDRFFNRISLADRANFGTFCNIEVLLFMENRGKSHSHHRNTYLSRFVLRPCT